MSKGVKRYNLICVKRYNLGSVNRYNLSGVNGYNLSGVNGFNNFILPRPVLAKSWGTVKGPRLMSQ